MDAIIEACKQDEDCPEKQYCYKLSAHCVNYTTCGRYNRFETDKLARNPFQCGPCFKGYTMEVLANSGDGIYCTKKMQTENSPIGTHQIELIWIIVGILSVLMVLFVVGYRLWKFSLKNLASCKREVECVEFNKDDAVETNANAPLEECNPFIESKEDKLPRDTSTVVAIDKLAGASAWQTPTWVSNANYGTNRLGDDDDDVDFNPPPNQGNNVIAQVSPVHNVPNINVPNINVPNINLPNNATPRPLFAIGMPESIADQDNARNLVLQTYMYNYEHNIDDNIDNDDSDNNDADSNDNNEDPLSEPNENGNKNRKQSMLVNQMLKNISMNVNVISVRDKQQSN